MVLFEYRNTFLMFTIVSPVKKIVVKVKRLVMVLCSNPTSSKNASFQERYLEEQKVLNYQN